MKRILNFILPLLCIGIVLIAPASAQQPKPSADEVSKSLLSNDQVNVKELRLRPKSKIGPAENPNSFVYPLTDGTIVITPPGRTGFEMSFRAGEALWLPSQLVTTSNETDKEIRVLVVEIKAKPPVKQGAKAKSKTKSKATAKGGSKTAAKPAAPAADAGKPK